MVCPFHSRSFLFFVTSPQPVGKLKSDRNGPDHCINHLRQMIQCYGDMTPIPAKYYPGLTRNYIDSDRLHTCRNFQAIRDWTTSRNNGSLAVEPQMKGERLRHGGHIPGRGGRPKISPGKLFGEEMATKFVRK